MNLLLIRYPCSYWIVIIVIDWVIIEFELSRKCISTARPVDAMICKQDLLNIKKTLIWAFGEVSSPRWNSRLTAAESETEKERKRVNLEINANLELSAFYTKCEFKRETQIKFLSYLHLVSVFVHINTFYAKPNITILIYKGGEGVSIYIPSK